MKQNTVLQPGNKWYSITVQTVPYTVVEMRQRPIGYKAPELKDPLIKAVVTKIKPAKAANDKAPKEGSKLAQAIALYKKNQDMDRKKFIKLLMTKLNMTLAGATTYNYNCVKHCPE